MPYLSPEKRGSGPKLAVVDHGRRYYPAGLGIADDRCTVCHFRMVQVLVDAGETTHPACAGWPRGMEPDQVKHHLSAVRRR